MWTTGKLCLGEGVRSSSDSLSGMVFSAKDVSGWVSSLLSDTVRRWTKEFWNKNKEKVAGYKMSQTAHRPWSIQFCYTEQRYSSSVTRLLIISESRLFLSFPFRFPEQTVTKIPNSEQERLRQCYFPMGSNLLQVRLWHFSPTKVLTPFSHLQHEWYSLSACISVLQKQPRQQEFCQKNRIQAQKTNSNLYHSRHKHLENHPKLTNSIPSGKLHQVFHLYLTPLLLRTDPRWCYQASFPSPFPASSSA